MNKKTFMKNKILLILLCNVIFLNLMAEELCSPGKKIVIRFSLSQEPIGQDLSTPEGTPYYEVLYNDKPFLLPSRLGFDVLGTAEIKHYFNLLEVQRSEKRSSWTTVYGEKDQYPDNYNEMRVILEEEIYPNRRLHIVFRAYDEGIAFRYELPDQPGFEKVIIDKEYTEFNFPQYSSVWESYGHEGKYNKVYPSEVKSGCELPLTCVTSSGIYGAIMEAGNSHYPRSYIEATDKRENKLCISLRGEAKGINGIQTAWRAIILSESPGGLIEQNYLLLNLSDPCRITDTSWIKPGTAMRETSISTQQAYRMIDFCSRKSIDYMIFDWGWYGVVDSHKSDPSIVNVVNPMSGAKISGHPGLDLHSVIKYANEKGVGIFLYVNRQGLERYADKIFPLYQKWGIKGIKPGFVNVGNQEWQEWMEMIIKKAAEHELLVDIHDAYRPNGFSRTYPNLLTQEGIRGNEHQPNADHDTMLPFTRFIIGAGDYTPGYGREDLQSTWVHKLALPIIYYSPVQFIFWREKPNKIHERPELKLWEDIPTVWNDTKVLAGEIGEYVVVARRSGKDWYVGGITNTNARAINIDFSFLEMSKKYKATIYNDTVNSGNEVAIVEKNISAMDKVNFTLNPSGGFAIKIVER